MSPGASRDMTLGRSRHGGAVHGGHAAPPSGRDVVSVRGKGEPALGGIGKERHVDEPRPVRGRDARDDVRGKHPRSASVLRVAESDLPPMGKAEMTYSVGVDAAAAQDFERRLRITGAVTRDRAHAIVPNPCAQRGIKHIAAESLGKTFPGRRHHAVEREAAENDEIRIDHLRLDDLHTIRCGLAVPDATDWVPTCECQAPAHS